MIRAPLLQPLTTRGTPSRAAHLVAPFLPVADPGLDPSAQGEAVCRVWLGEPHLSDTLARFSLPFTSVFVKAVCWKPARTV